MVLEFTIPGSIEEVYPYLAETDKFVRVHPAITRMIKTGDHHYQVYETLMIGPIPYAFSYPASIVSDPAGQRITMHATVMKLTRIHMDFNLTKTDAGTMINEQIVFSSPLPIKSLLRHTFKKQHGMLFNNIAAAIADR